MSDSSSVSEIEVSPSTDSLDTLIGLSTETGRTTAVSPSSSSAGPEASSDAALASSDSDSRPETPRQEGDNRTQNGDRSGVSRPEPPSGGYAELTAAAASAAATGPGPSDPAVNLLGMLHQMQENQLRAQLQQQQFQQQQQHQQEMLAALMQQLLPARSQAGPRPGAADTAPLLASPSLPAFHSTGQGQGPLPHGGPSETAPRAPRAPPHLWAV